MARKKVVIELDSTVEALKMGLVAQRAADSADYP